MKKQKLAKTTDLERGLFGKTFSSVMAKKHGAELLIHNTIKPLNRRITQYTVTITESKEVLYNGESLSNACHKFTNHCRDVEESIPIEEKQKQ